MRMKLIRVLVLPLLRELVGESVAQILNPCCRMLYWQHRAIVRTLRGKRARWAIWRYEVNRERCAALTDERCTAAEAADRVLGKLIATGDNFVAELLDAEPHVRRNVLSLLGPDARAALQDRRGGAVH